MMRRAFPLPLLLLAMSCAHGGGNAPVAPAPAPPATRGVVKVAIAPNPIVAVHADGNNYEFPFDIVLRETGGRPITITGVTVTVYAFGLPVNVDQYDIAEIRRLGFDPNLPANGDVRYHLQPRRAVTDDRIFGSITAGVRIDATDDAGGTTSDSIRVSVTR